MADDVLTYEKLEAAYQACIAEEEIPSQTLYVINDGKPFLVTPHGVIPLDEEPD